MPRIKKEISRNTEAKKRKFASYTEEGSVGEKVRDLITNAFRSTATTCCNCNNTVVCTIYRKLAKIGPRTDGQQNWVFELEMFK